MSKKYCCVVKIPVFRMVFLPFGNVRVGQKNKCFHLFLYVFIGFFFVRTCVRYKKWTFWDCLISCSDVSNFTSKSIVKRKPLSDKMENARKMRFSWKKNVVNACQFHKSPYLCTRFREATLLRLTQETRLRCWKIARRNRSLTDCEQYDKAVRLTSVSNTK